MWTDSNAVVQASTPVDQMQGCLRVPKVGKARLPLRAHLYMYMFLNSGRFWSSSSFPEEQCFEYLSPSNTMGFWGSESLPKKNCFEPNFLQRRKMPLQKVGEMGIVQYEGQFLPLLPPMDESRVLPLSVGAPNQIHKSLCTMHNTARFLRWQQRPCLLSSATKETF